ncbi:MAG: methionyl-tRNA formyltransferase [Pseudomonadota bacterium]
MRIVFMGTPEFSVPTLAAICDAGHDVIAVYSQPPRAAGRGQSERKSPVHKFADAAGITVHTPVSFKAASDVETFQDLEADAAVVVAYGLIVPRSILDAPKLGCYNMHASALPRWRGAAPIQRAIMSGDTHTAAIAMRMEAGLDTGPICLSEQIAIGENMTAGELHDVLATTGASVMVEALKKLEAGELQETPQDEEGVTYAAKIEKAEARLDFDRPARDVHNHVRGLSPFPGAWFEVARNDKSERIKVLRSICVDNETPVTASYPPGTVTDGPCLTIQCNPGTVQFTELQRAGKRPCPAHDVLCGFPMPAGEQLS